MSNFANAFASALVAEGMSVVNTATPKLEKLVGDESKKKEGTFVLQGQELATDKGFRNVSHIWYDKTMTYEQGLEEIERGRAITEDIQATVSEMRPAVDKKGNFAFYHASSDRYFVPTPHAITQVGNWADCGTWFAEHMLQPITIGTGKKATILPRDNQDADVLSRVLANGFRRLDQTKKFLWRTRKDGSLRAMLTERFAIIDNRWFIEKLREFIPGGRLSHWKGDSDSIYGNVLIPDTIRAESDSEYGGMLSIGNSEIGVRRVSSLPSIFRAICMNGCIWGATKGKGIKQVHRGKIDLFSLALEIQTNLNQQIPLLPVGIERFLGMRSMGWDGCDAKCVIAAVAKDYKLSKKQASTVMTGYVRETNITPDYARTLFNVVNGITRAAQEQQSPADWVAMDSIGGELSEYTQDDFKRLTNRAKSMSVKDVEEVFAGV